MNKSYHSFKALYPLFFKAGEVLEVRAFMDVRGKHKAYMGYLGASGVAFAYVDNPESLSKIVSDLAPIARAIYFTPNVCDPALFARAPNVAVAFDQTTATTSNHNIKIIRWLLIDFDPVRPPGISSTKDELNAALEVARSVTAYLEKELGFPRGIRAMSGNGYHIMYRLPDIENTEDISGKDGLIHRCLQVLNNMFSANKVKIDEVVYNPARIWKLYGTTAKKGFHTDERPHRKSHLLSDNPTNLEEVGILPLDLLEKLASQMPAKHQLVSSPSPSKNENHRAGQLATTHSSLGQLQVDKYLDHYGIGYRVKNKGAATWFLLDNCVFDSSHMGGEAAIVVNKEPPFLTYTCFHDSCSNRTWQQARAQISGTDKVAHFCENYDSVWQPNKKGRQPLGSGILPQIDIAEGFLVGNRQIPVPGPKEVDPEEFFTIRGKRESFNVSYATKYTVAYMDPIVYTTGDFWVHRNGVWAIEDENEVGKVVAFALEDKMQAAWMRNVKDMVANMRNRRERDWLPDQNLINLKNGMFNIETQELLPHAPEQWSRVQLPVTHDTNAECPEWEKAVLIIMGRNAGKVCLLQEFFGYCLLSTCKFEKALFMFGTGANGKSTVLNVLERLLIGQDNVSALNLDGLNRRFSVPTLRNKMINVSSEIETKDKAGTEVLKKAISGDLLEGEIKHGENITFRTYAKFIFAMNTPPAITDKAYGFARKILVINFTERFEGKSKDKDLFEKKLRPEASGILNWAIDGAKRLLKNGCFTRVAEVQKETNEFLASMNPVLQFFDEHIVELPESWVRSKELYQTYVNWCAESGLHSLSRPKFGEQVRQTYRTANYHRANKSMFVEGSRPHVFSGIGLRSSWSS